MKKIFKVLMIIVLVCVVFNIPIVLAEEGMYEGASIPIETSCNSVFTPEALSIVSEVLNWIRIIAPALLVVLVALDLGRAVMSNDQTVMKKATGNLVKRTIATACVFLTPTFVLLLLDLPGVEGLVSSDPLCSSATGTDAREAISIIAVRPDSNGDVQNRPDFSNETVSSGSSSTVTSNSGSGYSHTVVFGGRTYKVYKQGKYRSVRFWGGTVASHGCGPTSVAIVASGCGKNVTPVNTSKLMSYGSLGEVKRALSKLGIASSSSRTVSSKGVTASIAEIRSHLQTGMPVIVLVGRSTTKSPAAKYTGGGHFMVLLGENNGNLIIGNPSNSSSSGNLEDLVRHYMYRTTRSGRGYLLVESC